MIDRGMNQLRSVVKTVEALWLPLECLEQVRAV
jgi:hypothetical protein